MTNTPIVLMMVGAIALTIGAVYAFVPTNVPIQGLQIQGPKALGHIELVLTDENGNVKAYRQTDNLVVNRGVYMTSDKLFGTSLVGGATSAAFNNVGIGTGTTSATSGDTNVQTQLSNRKTGAVTSVTGSSTGAQIQAFFGAGKLKNGSGTTAVTEAGLFDTFVNGTGNLYARQTFTAINAGSSDSLTVTWSITFADSDAT